MWRWGWGGAHRDDEPPDAGSNQQLAKDVDSLLFTSNVEYKESGAKKMLSGITSLYLKEMHIVLGMEEHYNNYLH